MDFFFTFKACPEGRNKKEMFLPLCSKDAEEIDFLNVQCKKDVHFNYSVIDYSEAWYVHTYLWVKIAEAVFVELKCKWNMA